MITVDASVCIKWFILENEPYTEKAIHLFKQIGVGKQVIQPLHWQAEVVAVINRREPEIIKQAINLMGALELPVMDNTDVYHKASEISQQLNHHLFDALYHAVALLSDGVFITDDRKYYNKAKPLGAIQLLADIE